MKRLVVVGATGMVGGYATRYALEHPDIGHVLAVGRRPTGISHPKLSEVLHSDFGDCSALTKPLADTDGAIFCLGAYTGVVTDAELRRTTVDYTIEFARALHEGSPHAVFSFLSGSGADPSGKSPIAFARYKGEAETALLGMGFASVYTFRPAYIYPVQPRKEPNLAYRVMRTIYPIFRTVFPGHVIRADDLARAMVDVVIQGPGQRPSSIFENRDIQLVARSRGQ